MHGYKSSKNNLKSNEYYGFIFELKDNNMV